MRTAVLLFIAATLSVSACKKDEDGAKSSADEAPASSAPKAQDGQPRAVAIEVKMDGYHPSTVKAQAGEKLDLQFTRTEDTECGKEIVVEGATHELPMNEAVSIPVTMPADGELVFTCGMKMLKGTVAVATE